MKHPIVRLRILGLRQQDIVCKQILIDHGAGHHAQGLEQKQGHGSRHSQQAEDLLRELAAFAELFVNQHSTPFPRRS